MTDASWILCADPSDLDMKGIYADRRFFDVAQPAQTDIHKGDIIYVLTDMVRYKCRVADTDLYEPDSAMLGYYGPRGDRGRWSRGHAGYMRLEFLYRYDKVYTRRPDLKSHGMDPGVTFCRAEGPLLAYLEDRDRIDHTMALATGYVPGDLPPEHWSLPAQNQLEFGWEAGSERHVIRHTDDGFIRTAETYLAEDVKAFFHAEDLPMEERIEVPLLYENELLTMTLLREPNGVRLILDASLQEDLIEVYEEAGAYPLATFYKMPPMMLASILGPEAADKLPADEVIYLVLEDE